MAKRPVNIIVVNLTRVTRRRPIVVDVSLGMKMVPRNSGRSIPMNPETRSIGTFIESPPPSRRQQYVQTVQEYEDDDSKPVERRPKPSKGNEPLKWCPEFSNSDETTKKRPLLSTRTYTTKMRPESIDIVEPVKRSPEPSNSNKPLKWHPAISHSDEITKKRPMLGISTYPTKMRPEPSIEPVERNPEPSKSNEPLKWHTAISNSDETRKKRPVLGISTYPTKMRPESSIDPVERNPEPSNSNERLKGRSESSNSDKRKTRRALLSNRTYTSKTHPKTSNSNESLRRHPIFRSSRESLKSVNGEERKKSRRDAIGSVEREGSRGHAQWCRSCLRWSACVGKQSSSDQQIASPKKKSEPESSIFEPRKKSSQKDEPCKEGSVSVKSQEFPDTSLRNGQTNSKESKSREIESVIFTETYVAGKTNNILVGNENAGENVMALESSRETPPWEKQIQMLVEEENMGENVMALESSRETPPTERQLQMWVEEENMGENVMALESLRETPSLEKQTQMWVEGENTGENVMALESLSETPSPGKKLKVPKEKKTAGKGGVCASSKVIGSPLKVQSTKPVEKRPSPPHPVLRASRRCGGLNRPQTPAKEFLERKKLQLGYKRKIHPSMPHKDISTHGGTFPVSKTLAPVVNLPRHRTFILPTSHFHQESRSPCTVLQTPPSYTSTRRLEPPCYCFEATRFGNLSPRNRGPRENLCYCNVPDYVIRPCQSCCSETRDIVIHPPTCGHCRCPAPSNFVLAVCSQPRRYQHMLGPSLLQSLTRLVYRGDVFQEHQVFYHGTQELNSTLELSTGDFESKKNTCIGPFPLYKHVSTEFKEKAPNQKSMESGDTKRVIKVESRQPQHVTDYRLYSTESAKSPVLEFGEPYDRPSRENKSTISCEAALSLGKPLVRVLPWHLSTGDARRGVEEAIMTGEATAVHSSTITQYVQPWLLRIERETLEVTSTPQKIDQCLVKSNEDEQRYTCVPNVSLRANPQDERNTTMIDREDKYRNDIQHNDLTESSKEWQLPLQQNHFGEIFNHPPNNIKILWTRSNTLDDDNDKSLNTSSQNKSPLNEKLFRESIASDGEWDYVHCGWESNLPLPVRASGGAHALLTVQVSAGALKRLTTRMARPRPTGPKPQEPEPKGPNLTPLSMP
uniref:Uncharacterized protein n=1 Tax=Timema poppense TaxID=170557 RepID=A0A7R9H8Z5_TIMPO|nr:unnamed protein product [Timema poppensis]